MAVTPDRAGPYAPAKVIIDLIERYRSRGLPSPINGEVLARAGVSDSLSSRTLQALATLDLIDAEGKPSAALEGMRVAPEAEYLNRMGEWLTAAYADALQFVDPGTANETEVRDAFRQYKPVGQQDRMVSLFMGLFRHAGLAPEKTPTGGAAPRKKANVAVGKPKTEKARTPPPGAPDPGQNKGDGQGNGIGQNNEKDPAPQYLTALLAKFPDFDPAWSDDIKAKWFEGFDTFMKGAAK